MALINVFLIVIYLYCKIYHFSYKIYYILFNSIQKFIFLYFSYNLVFRFQNYIILYTLYQYLGSIIFISQLM